MHAAATAATTADVAATAAAAAAAARSLPQQRVAVQQQALRVPGWDTAVRQELQAAASKARGPAPRIDGVDLELRAYVTRRV